jgi:hypothetical protein
MTNHRFGEGSSAKAPNADDSSGVTMSVEFPAALEPNESSALEPNEQEQLRRVRKEAERLLNLPEVERNFYLSQSTDKTLKAAVKALLHTREQQEKTDRRAEDQERKRRQTQQRAQERAQERETREQERRKRKAEREAERKQKQAEQEAERKAKAKMKAFGNLAKLPTARHENGLAKLSAQLGADDLAALHAEFKDFLGVDGGDAAATEQTEPWPEQIDIAELLMELGTKVRRYAVTQEHQLDAAMLYAAHAWLYDHDVPIHSPILAATSAEIDSGKSTLVAVLGRAMPRYSLNVEMTGPSLYRFIDAVKPTLVIDEADDLFARRSDLKHVINAG